MTVPEMVTFASEYFDNFNSLNYYTSRNVAPDGAVDGYEKTWYNEFINVSLIRAPYPVNPFFSMAIMELLLEFTNRNFQIFILLMAHSTLNPILSSSS